MSPRAAPSRCTTNGCSEWAQPGNKGKCDEHKSSGWVDRRRLGDQYGGSARRAGASAGDLEAWKRAVRQRDMGTCYVCGEDGSDEVDHIVPVLEGGALLDLANGGEIHSDPCHRRKTSRELAKARGKYRGRTY